ncbi:MAG: transcription antitermination factor NusB [Puniceicoccales bacterium]|jgi:N utilization substance protein B|nr:transcription antitermination factor NusB [Puniceicoccales bacterium]
MSVAIGGDAGKVAGRRDNRSAAMQLLYLHDLYPFVPVAGHWQNLQNMLGLPDAGYEFCLDLAAGTIANLKEINGHMQRLLVNWSPERVERVPVAILRLALYELIHRRDMPVAVVINEAVELGKRFAGPAAARFINGLLDQFHRDREAAQREPCNDLSLGD